MPAYFDHNATTPIAPQVMAAMQPFMTGAYGNASSAHGYGKAARAAIETAREQIAAAVNAHPSEVIFTSGGTEANNWVLRSVLQTSAEGSVAVSAIEHPAILTAAQQVITDIAKSKASNEQSLLHVLPVDRYGRVSSQVKLPGDCRLVSVMWANNETGAVQPIAALAEQVKAAGALMHSDAVQALGKVPVDFRASDLSFMSLAAHKLYGPKGIGALVIDRRTQVSPMLFGGGHEQGLRPGTENLPAIVGFGVAAELAQQNLAKQTEQAQQLQQQLLEGLRALNVPIFTPPDEPRLPNTVQFAVPGMEGETLLMLLDAQGFAVSSGSACATGKHEPSHVLSAMAIEPDVALSAIRVSFSMNPDVATTNTSQQVTDFLQVLANFMPPPHG